MDIEQGLGIVIGMILFVVIGVILLNVVDQSVTADFLLGIVGG